MKKIGCFFIVLISFCLSGCKSPQHVLTQYDICSLDYYNYLDTISRVVVEYPKKYKNAMLDLNEIHDILLNIETEFSTKQTLIMKSNEIEKSSLMKLNETKKAKVSDDFLYVLKWAKTIAKNSNFNPAIGMLSSLWDITNQLENGTSNIPLKEDITNCLNHINPSDIIIDENEKTVTLNNNIQLDLGGIAKGFAADKILNFLKDKPYTYISINLGGNILNYGKSYLYNEYSESSDIVPIGLENPRYDVLQKTILLDIFETNVSVVTSGISKRYIVAKDEQNNEKKYHHILDSKTGYPVENNIESVTIIGKESMICDALSTGAFVQIDDAVTLIKESGYKGVIVTKDFYIYIVGDLKYELKDIQNIYKIIQK